MYVMNMPKWANERMWSRAKAIFASEYGRKPKRKRDWKVVMTIYESEMKGVKNGKKKKKK